MIMNPILQPFTCTYYPQMTYVPPTHAYGTHFPSHTEPIQLSPQPVDTIPEQKHNCPSPEHKQNHSEATQHSAMTEQKIISLMASLLNETIPLNKTIQSAISTSMNKMKRDIVSEMKKNLHEYSDQLTRAFGTATEKSFIILRQDLGQMKQQMENQLQQTQKLSEAQDTFNHQIDEIRDTQSDIFEKIQMCVSTMQEQKSELSEQYASLDQNMADHHLLTTTSLRNYQSSVEEQHKETHRELIDLISHTMNTQLEEIVNTQGTILCKMDKERAAITELIHPIQVRMQALHQIMKPMNKTVQTRNINQNNNDSLLMLESDRTVTWNTEDTNTTHHSKSIPNTTTTTSTDAAKRAETSSCQSDACVNTDNIVDKDTEDTASPTHHADGYIPPKNNGSCDDTQTYDANCDAREQDTNTEKAEGSHTEKELLKAMRWKDDKCVYMNKVPERIAHTLNTNKWFGKFGSIKAIRKIRHKAGFRVFVHYHSAESAKDAMAHTMYITKDRELRKRWGHIRYCHKFIDGQSCKNGKCTKLHRWRTAVPETSSQPDQNMDGNGATLTAHAEETRISQPKPTIPPDHADRNDTLDAKTDTTEQPIQIIDDKDQHIPTDTRSTGQQHIKYKPSYCNGTYGSYTMYDSVHEPCEADVQQDESVQDNDITHVNDDDNSNRKHDRKANTTKRNTDMPTANGFITETKRVTKRKEEKQSNKHPRTRSECKPAHYVTLNSQPNHSLDARNGQHSWHNKQRQQRDSYRSQYDPYRTQHRTYRPHQSTNAYNAVTTSARTPYPSNGNQNQYHVYRESVHAQTHQRQRPTSNQQYYGTTKQYQQQYKSRYKYY
eukprot:685478_1